MAFNTVCHIEWSVTDLERAKSFYNGLFGWRIETWGEMSNYTLWYPPEGVGGGFQKEKEIKPGQSPLVHILVEDIDVYLKKTEELGGKVVIGRTEIPTIGWYAVLLDPDGNSIGLFQDYPKK